MYTMQKTKFTHGDKHGINETIISRNKKRRIVKGASMWDKVYVFIMTLLLGIIIGYYWAYTAYDIKEVIIFNNSFLI